MIKKILFVFDFKQKIQLFLLFLAIIIGAVLELLGVTAVLPFISVLTSPQEFSEKWYAKLTIDLFNINSRVNLIIIFAILIIFVYITKNTYLVFLGNIQFKFISSHQRKLSTKLLDVYMKQNYLFHLENSSVDLHRNITVDTQTFFRTVLSALQILTDLIICLTLFLFLFSTDKMITISLTFIMMGYIVIYILRFKKEILFLGDKNRKYSAIITRIVLQALGGIKETKILNKENFFIRYYDKNYQEYIDAQRKNNLLSIIPKALLETICVSGILIVVCIKLIIGTELNYFVPIISTFAVAAFRMLPSFNKISTNVGIFLYGIPSIDALYNDIIRLKDLETKNESNFIHTNKNLIFSKEIRIKSVSFKYPNSSNIVLDNINFTINRNDSIALIGPSGAGKTTLADIILGVLEPCEGQVLVDSVDIRDNMIQWHGKLGYIPQNIYLMDDSLKKNIAYGLDEKSINTEKIWEVLELAQLKEFVQSLDNGLDTMIGEFGTRLSGGQRQRIGIARALYNEPEILVLDEATSALDNETENAVMDAVNNLLGTKTLIIIAHRLSTIEKCNAVFKIEDRKIIKIR